MDGFRSAPTLAVFHPKGQAMYRGIVPVTAHHAQSISFFLDAFTEGNQIVQVGQEAPAATRTETNLTEVLGGSRRLDLSLVNQSGTAGQRATARFITHIPDGGLALDNASEGHSLVRLRYDANGQGLNQMRDDQGHRLGNWLAGKYHVDGFQVLVKALDARLKLVLSLEDSQGAIVSATRTAIPHGESSLWIDNPVWTPRHVALFRMAELLRDHPEFRLDSVFAVELWLVGHPAMTARLAHLAATVSTPPPAALALLSLSLLMLNTPRRYARRI